jgi:hypothetical protein
MISDRVLVVGNTFHVKEQLKQLGGTWDAKQKGWSMPAEHAEQAQALVDGSPVPTEPRAAGWSFDPETDDMVYTDPETGQIHRRQQPEDEGEA